MKNNNNDSVLKDFYIASVVVSIVSIALLYISDKTDLPIIENLGLALLAFVILINIALLTKGWIYKIFSKSSKNGEG